jgi:formyltetrahydrofolate deformylase
VRDTVRLLINCPDAKGIVAAVAGFVVDHGGNILYADQHTDLSRGDFFMRVEIDLDGFGLDSQSFDAAWSEIAGRYRMRWRVHWSTHVKRMAIMASRESHCLADLLWRWSTGELTVEIPLVIANHDNLAPIVERQGVPFYLERVQPGRSLDQEARVLRRLKEAEVDFVVLARYMQVLSPSFVEAFAGRIINIHHGFLPAFAGARAYHQAYERGVKMIGATSHYVTDELDAGPIIAQQTLPVGHRDTIEDLVRKGRDLERVVLATAVRQHVQDKVLLSGNRTVVFD